MIETYFVQATVLDRLRSGPIGPHLAGFVTALEQRCYSRDTIRRCVRGADALSRWLDDQNVALVEANRSHVEAYVSQHARLPDARYVHGRLSKAASSLSVIAALLREQGILLGLMPVSQGDAWLVRFDNLLHLSAAIPATEVPSAALVARAQRRKPFLFSADQIRLLLKAALSLGPAASLRPYTVSTLIGLLASAGLRASEALHLTGKDVLLEIDSPRLEIRETNFHKGAGA